VRTEGKCKHAYDERESDRKHERVGHDLLEYVYEPGHDAASARGGRDGLSLFHDEFRLFQPAALRTLSLRRLVSGLVDCAGQ
jgi:hypothetical protein